MSEFDDWVGRTMTMMDVLEPSRSNALDRALGGEGNHAVGDVLPPLDHWLYFWNVQPPCALGRDGHPTKQAFLPQVTLPRRMWAGGRLTFHKPLVLGAKVIRTSTITSVKEKTGRSGQLIFVTVQHELDGGEGLALTEEQDIVFREASTGMAPPPRSAPVPLADFVETMYPDPVLLFRYSALTMNGHRIHYDRPYAMNIECYSGLVVQGPLQAKLLIRLASKNLTGRITGFDFRSEQPAVDGLALHVCGDYAQGGAESWTQQGKEKNMVATVRTGQRPDRLDCIGI